MTLGGGALHKTLPWRGRQYWHSIQHYPYWQKMFQVYQRQDITIIHGARSTSVYIHWNNVSLGGVVNTRRGYSSGIGHKVVDWLKLTTLQPFISKLALSISEGYTHLIAVISPRWYINTCIHDFSIVNFHRICCIADCLVSFQSSGISWVLLKIYLCRIF